MSQGSPTPIHVFVVLGNDVLLLDVVGPVEVLRRANEEQSELHFEVSYVGPSNAVNSSIGLPLTGIPKLPGALPDGAILLLPGQADAPLATNLASAAAGSSANDEIVDWLARVVRPGIRLVCICSGSLLAARAGLLDGYECTTHHAATAELAELSRLAKVKENRLFVEDGERLTSAGVTAGIDLMLHVVAGLVGHSVAIAVARHLVVYMRRTGSDPQLSPWLEGRNHIHPVVHRAQDAIEADPARPWSVPELARLAGASPRNLSRLFSEQAGLTIPEFVARARIAFARELLTQPSLGIEAVAERAGFGSSRQLRRTWARFHELPPSQMRH